MRKLLIGAGIYLCATAAALFGCGDYESAKVNMNKQPKDVHYIQTSGGKKGIWVIDTNGDSNVDEAVSVKNGAEPCSLGYLVSFLDQGKDIKLWKHYFVPGLSKEDRAVITDNSEEMPEEMRNTLDAVLQTDF